MPLFSSALASLHDIDTSSSHWDVTSCSKEASSSLTLGLPPAGFRRSSASAPRGVRRALHTAFGEVTCKDGFRCVSSTVKFGRNHVINETVGQGDPSDMASDPDAEVTYEWNCPYQGTWSPFKYTTGDGSDACSKANQDCMCVTRGSSDFTTTMEEGKEIMNGQFGVDPDGTLDSPDLAKMQQLKVIPHYAMRQLPETFNMNDPHSDMGKIVTLPQKTYLDKLGMYGTKLQEFLDKYKEDLEQQWESRAKDLGGGACGSAPKYSNSEAMLALTKIRRFQILSQDCEVMRDNIAKVAPTPEDERFPGKVGSKSLNCYKMEGTTSCQQLNCYNGPDDAKFRNMISMFRRRMETCVPEQDATEKNTEPPSPKGAADAAGAPAAAAAAAAAAAPAPAKSSVGWPVAALVAVLPPIAVSAGRREEKMRRCDRRSVLNAIAFL